MRNIGAVGGLLGLLVGEACNVMGIIGLCVVEIRRYPGVAPAADGPAERLLIR
jgi:hypothetical protein